MEDLGLGREEGEGERKKGRDRGVMGGMERVGGMYVGREGGRERWREGWEG